MPQAVYVTLQTKKIVIETPFNQDFIDDLKENIPGPVRAWDPDNKCWVVYDKKYKNSIRQLVRNNFKDYKAYLVQGAIVKNLHTGEMINQWISS